MGNDNSLLIVVLAVVAYLVMTGTKIGGAVSSAITSACPKGQRYSRGFFGDCDPNYVDAGLKYGYLNPTCECLSQTPSSNPESAHSPQTPVPKTDYCPYDVNILAGDSRCVPERIYQSVLKIPECPEGTYPTWYGGCEVGGGHL